MAKNALENSSCLVTGGAGFIGSHLTERLLREGAQVTVLDDYSTGSPKNLAHLRSNPEFGSRLRVVEGSVTNESAVKDALGEATHVFHLAALPAVPRSVEDPLGTHTVNVLGSLVLLEQCRRLKSLKRFVFTSSSSVYGDTPTLPKSEKMAGQTLSPYALQKWTGENYVRLYHALYGFPGVSLRPFNVFGPRQSPDNAYAAVIPLFISAAKAGKPLTILGDGEQTRDFTHIDNMVELYFLAGTSTNPKILGESFNAGAGDRHTVMKLAKLVLEFTGSRSEIVHLDPRPGDIRDSYADLSRARELLGYQPKVTFEEGLERLIKEA